MIGRRQHGRGRGATRTACHNLTAAERTFPVALDVTAAVAVSMYGASKFAATKISEALGRTGAVRHRADGVEPDVFRAGFLDATSLSPSAGRIASCDGTPAHTTLT